MYAFITHTWNVVRGRCVHNCTYCYMHKIWDWKNTDDELRIATAELDLNLGVDKFIFVGSSTDMFAKNVPIDWIKRTLAACVKHANNKYLFQSKNPAVFTAPDLKFPSDSVFVTTIETNRDQVDISDTPSPRERAIQLRKVRGRRMVNIEPIMDFDLDELVKLIMIADPEWITIGADSMRKDLPEPSPMKVQSLIKTLRGKDYQVRFAKNLNRLL